MAINYPNFAQTPKWALDFPDIGKTMEQGQERAIKPREQAEELVKTMLANKVQGAKAKYAQQMEEANLNHILAQTTGLGDTHGMAGLNRQLLQQKVNQGNYEQNLNNSLFGGGEHGAAPSGQQGSSIPSYQESLQPKTNASEQNQNVVNEGNPSLYHIDEAYNKDPRARKYLESKGFKKTQTTKYDPKSGVVSTITTDPSGRVTVQTTKPSNTGYAPLTEKTKSTQQNIVTGVDSAIPSLKKILDLDVPKQGIWNVFSPENQASYSGISGGAIDSIVAGMGLPKIQSSTDLVKDMVHRKSNEGEDHYKDRIRDLILDLHKRKKQALQTLTQGINLKNDEEIEETKVLNGKTYHKVNGEWHE